MHSRSCAGDWLVENQSNELGDDAKDEAALDLNGIRCSSGRLNANAVVADGRREIIYVAVAEDLKIGIAITAIPLWTSRVAWYTVHRYDVVDRHHVIREMPCSIFYYYYYDTCSF